MTGIWAELGIPSGSDRDTIRRAYARKLRVTNPEDDAEGFKRLRAAYDQALAQAEYSARWGDFEDDDGNEVDESVGHMQDELAAISDPLAQPEPALLWYDADPDLADGSDEAIALRAARDSDLAALRAAMGDLENALRGVWRAPDAELEALFAHILASPALGEITVRGDVEAWAAQVIADTIPKSDAILAQAVTAFGWDDNSHHMPYAAHETLARLDEWRQIAAFNKPIHPQHAAWQSLTKPPAWGPLWRIKALSPGLVRGVRSLLGEFGWVSPGLHFSFNAASLERWQAYLAKPRVTLAMLMLAFAVWSGLHFALGTIPALHGRLPYAAGAAIAVTSLLAPIIAWLVDRRRHARAAAGFAPSVWLHDGWAVAFIALGLTAILLPATPLSGMIVMGAGLIVLGWVVVGADPAEPTAVWPAIGRWLIGGWLYLILGIQVAGRLVPPAQVMLGVVVLLAVLIRTTMTEQARNTLARVAPMRPLLVGVGGIGAIVALGALATWARLLLYRGGDGAMFIGGVVTLLIALPWLALFGPRYVRWAAAAHVIAILAFCVLAGPLLPDQKRSAASDPSAPLSKLFDTKQPIEREVDADTPFIGALRANNSIAYLKILLEISHRHRGEIDAQTLNDRTRDIIEQAFRDRLAAAPDVLLVEERSIALAQLRALRSLDQTACAKGDLSVLGAKMSDELGRRTDALFRNVASSALVDPGERAKGKRIDAETQLREAAVLLGRPAELVAADLRDTTPTPLKCNARIALLQVLLQHEAADIAATARSRMAKGRTKPR